MNYVINTLILLIQLYIIFLQVLNFLNYRLVNGANKKRIVMFLCAIAMLGHIIRHIHDPAMWFLLTVSLLGVILYEGLDFTAIKKELVNIRSKRETK